MFFGESAHNLDPKGRIILPVRFREGMEEAFITSETDGCLSLSPRPALEERLQEMKQRLRGQEDDRDIARFFFSGAQEARPDKQGRIAIPPSLREFAHLERDVVIVGVFDHVEIWSATVWQERKQAGAQLMAARRTQQSEPQPA